MPMSEYVLLAQPYGREGLKPFLFVLDNGLAREQYGHHPGLSGQSRSPVVARCVPDRDFWRFSLFIRFLSAESSLDFINIGRFIASV